MERLVLRPGDPWREAAARAAAVLRAGGVTLLPAEGVYGLHALAENPAAVERLLAMKPRAPEKGFIALIADPAEIARWSEPSARADDLAGAHWPGALTIVLRALPSVPESMRHPGGTVALRCPGSEFLRAVVSASGGLVISTSANEPGDPAMVRPEGPLLQRVDLVVDQGALSGTPSTVVAVEGNDLRVVREGAIRLPGRRT
jgi:L-threonylcarbamoyladenylate synthase